MISKRHTRKLKNALRRHTSLLLAFAIITEVTYPTQMYALTGGPSQPEVQSFEPVGTSDMVDVATGDFNYNIPLLDVDGYPINIAYHSGITMDQEASWVGLGWNINPGVINRNMRGLPDDFSGDVVTKEMNIKANKTWGVSSNLNFEVYGYPINIGLSNAFSFNNYTGPSVSNGFNVSLSASKGAASATASLGLNSSSDDGLTIQPSLSFSARVDENTQEEKSLGLNVGTAYNSRAGLKQLTIGVQANSPLAQKISKFTRYIPGVNRVAGAGLNLGGSFDFGMPTYTPSISTSMQNFGISGNFTLGGEIWGVDAKIGVGGFFSSQKLASKNTANPAFGYLYSENGQSNDNALMDFNREKDATFSENTAFLPITNYTFDTYSVSGQGVAGSYRPFRSEVGYVFDPAGYTTNDDDALTVEVGIGGWVHIGSDVSVTDVNGKSGKWKNDNDAITNLKFHKRGKGNDFENVYFREANEKSVDQDTTFYALAGYDNPMRPFIDFSDKFEHKLTGFTPIKRKKRAKKNQPLSFLKRSEYNDFAVQPVNSTYAGMGHHIAEITTLSTDGTRYVYGIAAYNTLQKEVTFAVGGTDPTMASPRFAIGNEEATNGLIGYNPDDRTTDNQLGEDNYYSSTTTPAYAHSYLLTSVLSADYVDADNVRGPSDNDYGNYTRFAYSKVSDYKWRTPFDLNKGTYTEGLKSDLQDDRANYIYGEKELWYLDSVVTKNYIAIFYKSCREDGAGVKDDNGGYLTGASKKMLRLDSIALFSKQDLRANPTTALPIKCVHFEYTYDLCGNIPNVTGTPGPTAGKLTLKKIFFTYQSSNKARLSPYIFDYHEHITAENPEYNIKAYDRWGNYKKNEATTLGVRGDATDISNFVADQISPADFPYVIQDRAITDVTAAAWSLKEIQLPSGGKIIISYEADDYAYVQDRQAMQMFKVINYGYTSDASNTAVDFSVGGLKFYFKLHNGVTDIHKYTDNIKDLYFRFLVNIRTLGYDHLEYVSGYGEIEEAGISGPNGWIKLKSVGLKDNGSGTAVNPIVKTAIQFARLYMPKKAWTTGIGALADNAGLESTISTQILDAMLNSSYIKNIKDALVGPNESLYGNPYNVGQTFIAGKSWFRLHNPDKHKLGGGLRVKKIEISDEWSKMVNNTAETSNYGQEYDYNLSDGTSSGVASYEPQLGGDENPFRQPVYTSVDKLGVPDDQFYQERPVGECFFPTPEITYSMITVKNLERDGVKRHATGKIVHEFYTSKDFPTITKRTSLKHKRGKDSPFSLVSLLKINARDYLTAAQGFVVELNDMQGKPKSQKVYQEGQSTPISSVEYKYKQENYLNGSYKLTNKCTTIEKNGNISVKRIGEMFDMVADFREDKTETNNTTLQINVDVIPAGPYPLSIPMMWPNFAKEKTRFRSATTTKVIQRFGILEETIATDLGSVVSTKNLAYDAETGDVLLTQTTTNYNDKVYNFKYPAWWYYESMGPAYQNIDFEMNSVSFTGGTAIIGTAATYFKEGDELALTSNIGSAKGWVNAVSTNSISVIRKDGSNVNGTYNLRIIRSGKRNMTTVDMATITTLTNPLGALKSNAYENILQASAIEFSNRRKAYCDCIMSPESNIPYSTNDYITGKKGNWRPLKSYTHLTQRNQSNYDNNTNIRRDGVFTSYTPYYRWIAGSWHQDPKDWTYVSEVSEFNVYGEELENKDALGRYSSATFGYNQSMALSVAANAMRKEEGFDGFEDYKFNPCADGHFKIDSITPVNTASHTGKYSLKVSNGAPKTLRRQLAEVCSDSTECSLSLSTSVSPPSTINATVTNAQGPYSCSWNIISGAPVILLTATGLQITGSGDYRVELMVTDSKGCTDTDAVSHNN